MVRLTDHFNMTIVFDWGVKPQNKQIETTLLKKEQEKVETVKI